MIDSLDYGAVNTCTGRNSAYGTDSLYREGLRLSCTERD